MVTTTDFTANDPHQGAWLVYINGIEIPCPSVTVSYGVWAIPEANITLAPHKLLHRLGAEDRLEVVIFYLDTTLDPANPQFRLLFEGEIVGWSYRNSAVGRMMSFNAVADISIFTQLYFFFLNNVDTVASFYTQPGANVTGYAQAGAFFPFALFQQGLLTTDQGQNKGPPKPTITRPYELIYNAVKGMVSNKATQGRAIPAVNFFSRWVRKRNFLNRFAALPVFEDTNDPNLGAFPIFKAVQNTTALETLQTDLAASIGDSGSMWDVLKFLLGKAYFEIAMIPTAPCFRVQVADKINPTILDGTILGTEDYVSDPLPLELGTTSDSTATQTQTTRVYSPGPTEPLRVINYFAKPQMLFSIPPMCNVIFPSMSPSFTYNESYMAQPTRTYINDSFITGALRSQNKFFAQALTVGYPPAVNAVLSLAKDTDDETAKKTASSVLKNGKNLLVFPEEFFKGPVIHRMAMPSWIHYLYSQLKNTKPTVSDTPEADKEQTSFKNIFRLYAEYEYYRTRYEKRGGTVDMAWNPYVVPGFPCVVFDNRSSSFDMAGYVLNVSQTLAVGAMRTSINFGFGRTLQEMLELLASDMDRIGVAQGFSPAEPVTQIREIGQNFVQAEKFYNTLFHGKRSMGSRMASFDFRKIIGYVGDRGWYDDEEVIPLTVEGPTKVSVEDSLNYTLEELQAMGKPKSNVREASQNDLTPLPETQELFRSYDAAMQYIARPICTLHEYIRFMHAGKKVSELIKANIVMGVNNKYAYTESQGDVTDVDAPSAIYFDQIYVLRPGPGEEPSPAATGVSVTTEAAPGTTNVTATPYTEAPEGVGADFAQTRADWATILKQYRDEILTRDAPQR